MLVNYTVKLPLHHGSPVTHKKIKGQGSGGTSPEVTSTSTGRMMNCSWLGAFVLIRMKAVWLSASLDEKLARITPFVSNGGIS